jgi:hypothetical protein
MMRVTARIFALRIYSLGKINIKYMKKYNGIIKYIYKNLITTRKPLIDAHVLKENINNKEIKIFDCTM